MENHVASMVDAKGEQMSDTKAICSNTHAYFCMDDDKQDLPAQLFEAIRVLGREDRRHGVDPHNARGEGGRGRVVPSEIAAVR